jgi:hypothetical protein
MDEQRRIREWVERTFDLSWKDEWELWLALGLVKRKAGKMGEFFWRFWTDQAYFIGVCRFTTVALTGAFLTGKIMLPQPYEGWLWTIAPYLAAVAAGVPAGQTNRTDAETKAVSHDPNVPPAALGDIPKKD